MARVVQALERPDLASSPDYTTLADRFRNRPKLMEQLSLIFGREVRSIGLND